MGGRWIAGAILLVMLAVVAIFLWAVIHPPAPAPAVTAGDAGAAVVAQKRVSGRSGSWTLAAQAVPGAGRTIAVSVSVADAEGRPLASRVAPTAVLNMLDMAMEPERVNLVQDAAGSWLGSTRLSMAGRWNLKVELNGEMLNLPFEAR